MEQTAYIGDDGVDLLLLQPVAFLLLWWFMNSTYVQNAVWIIYFHLRKGAFREMSDMILHAQGKDEVYTSSQKGF